MLRRFDAPYETKYAGAFAIFDKVNTVGDPDTMRQAELYEPIRRWLASEGFASR